MKLQLAIYEISSSLESTSGSVRYTILRMIYFINIMI